MKPLLEVRDLQKDYSNASGTVRAVDGVSISVRQGEVVGLVGESGSGKSTLGRLILRLTEPSAGRVLFRGTDLTSLSGGDLRAFRAAMQVVFQDPYASLNRRMRVRAILQEPLRIHGVPQSSWAARIDELLDMVGLPTNAASMYPHEFSGGQRQRIGIARALAVEPEFIVADEPVSALDVSVQAQVLNLLDDLRTRLGLSMLFIAHDLAVIRHIADRVLVMYLGRVVEEARTADLFDKPSHPYTRALLSAVPKIEPRGSKNRTVLMGEVPSAMDAPSGCVFRTRCPLAESRCAEARPPLEEVAAGHLRACWVT